MGKLKRQVVVLALCLAAVLMARFYVNRFLDNPSIAATSESEAPAAVSEVLPGDGGAEGGLTVEMPARPNPTESGSPAAATGPVAGTR